MSPARAVPHPLLSSPKRLALAAIGVTLAVYAVQLASGVPAWRSWSPVELSSNVVAMMGVAWAAIQLRASWRAPDLRRVWAAGALGMALLSVEDHVGELFLLESHGPDEMSLSIAIWLVAAWLIFRVGRRYAMRQSVRSVLRLGLALQLASQLIGWRAAYGDFSESAGDMLDYVNDTGELLAVLAYLVAMLLAVFSANKTYRFPPTAIGRKGREIHRDFGLGGPGRSRPALRSFGRPVGAAIALARCWARAAEAVRRAGGPAPARQLLDILACRLLSGVDAKSYYFLELFRRRPLGRAADAVMTRAETKNGLTASIQRSRGDAGGLAHDLDDRAAFARVCLARGLPAAPVLAIVERGVIMPVTGDPSAFDRDLTVRARRASAGKLALRLTRVEPMLYRDEQGDLVNIDMALSRLRALSLHQPLVIGPRLANHEAIARHAADSLLLFRVVTCLDERGEPVATHGVMRIQSRLEPGWPASPVGEWGAAIELGGGVFGPVVGDAPETSATRRYAHPVTGDMIAGRVCPVWREVARAAIEAHRVFDGHVVIGWDIAATPDGPRILDGDANMDFRIIQRCYGAPIGRSPLAPLLDAHLDRVVALRQ